MLRSFTFGFAQHTCELGVTVALGENRSRVNEHQELVTGGAFRDARVRTAQLFQSVDDCTGGTRRNKRQNVATTLCG